MRGGGLGLSRTPLSCRLGSGCCNPRTPCARQDCLGAQRGYSDPGRPEAGLGALKGSLVIWGEVDARPSGFWLVKRADF